MILWFYQCLDRRAEHTFSPSVCQLGWSLAGVFLRCMNLSEVSVHVSCSQRVGWALGETTNLWTSGLSLNIYTVFFLSFQMRIITHKYIISISSISFTIVIKGALCYCSDVLFNPSQDLVSWQKIEPMSHYLNVFAKSPFALDLI